jgi:hypothetical protein
VGEQHASEYKHLLQHRGAELIRTLIEMLIFAEVDQSLQLTPGIQELLSPHFISFGEAIRRAAD